MKQLLNRITDIERSMITLVERYSTLKEENEILSANNIRLTEELNQLRKSSESEGDVRAISVEQGLRSNHDDINIEQIKRDLDYCIGEVEECLKHL